MNNQFPGPAGHTLAKAAQHAVGLPCYQGTWLPQAQLVHQLAEGALRPLIQITDKDFKPYKPCYKSLRDAISHPQLATRWASYG